jgi:glucokinase
MRVAGVDVGATNLRSAVADDEGTVLGRARTDTPAGSGGAAVTDAVRGVLRRACGAAGVAPDDLAGVGVGSMGPLDVEAGIVREPPNLSGVSRVELVDPLRTTCGCPVWLGNDAVAGVLAERFYDDAPPNVVYLTISSGIGAGAVVDGHLLRGASGNAAEMGHVVVEPGGLSCGCGGRGHWEAYCSGEGLPCSFRRLARETDLETDLPLDTLTAETVFDADDPLAATVLERIGTYNARGVAAVVHAFDPTLVTVGGAVARNHPDAVLDPIRRRLPDIVATDPPTVRLTNLGDAVVLKGAVAAALRGGFADEGTD